MLRFSINPLGYFTLPAIARGLLILAALAMASESETLRADADLDGLFTPGCVLQRDAKIPIFGTADDGDEVTIKLLGQTKTTTAKDGKWRVELGPFEAGGPYVLSLTGASLLNVKNVFVGDVWVCFGESNMQSPVQNSEGYSSAILSRKNRELHFFSVKRAGAATPQHGNESKWSDGGAATVGAFSAVGYYFGRDIQATTDVPVGLIQCNHYASSIEAWMTRESILAEPALKHLVEDAPARLDAQTPGKLFNGMVSLLAGFPIKGVICYQGESNVERPEEYRLLLPMMIADWRKAWDRPDLPFVFVQLTGYKPATSKPNESKLAALRDVQAAVVSATPHTAIVVSTDLGDQYKQIPKAKEPIGKRLAYAARVLVYGEKFECSGPTFKEATLTDQTATLKFDHLGDGLLAKDGKLFGFTIAGEDEEFVPAQAEIVGDTVVVKNPEVKSPKYVRYNWVDFTTGNLFNKDGFPAAPFRVTLPKSTPAIVKKSNDKDAADFLSGVLRLFTGDPEKKTPDTTAPPPTKPDETKPK